VIRHRTVRYNLNEDAHESGPHVATVSLDMLASGTRTIDNAAFFARWREAVGPQPDVIALKFTEPTRGPAGRPIEIRLSGADLDDLKAASEDLKACLARMEYLKQTKGPR